MCVCVCVCVCVSTSHFRQNTKFHRFEKKDEWCM